MKFKTYDDWHKRDYAQTFSNEKTCYVLDEASGELVPLATKKDLQAEIDSYLSTRLEEVIGKFINTHDSPEEVVQADYSSSRADLAMLGEAIELADEYRERLHLPANLSVEQVFSEVDKLSDSLKQRLSDVNLKKAEKAEKKDKDGEDK